MIETSQIRIELPDGIALGILGGPADEHFKHLEDTFNANIAIKDGVLAAVAASPDIDYLSAILSDLVSFVADGGVPDRAYVDEAIRTVQQDGFSPQVLREDVILTYRGHAVHPRTPGQKRYVDAIRTHTVTFGSGPAGTGKTYLAMAMAISALERKEVGRLILSRPILEAGENLGFLPGTLTEKVDPYIRPLYDALFDMMDGDRALGLLESGTIEIAPLAFMRGRTLNDSFIILDEAQNTTPEQMKMFLTRLGYGSKMVITGDESQSDLNGKLSGLTQAKRVLNGIDDIAFCTFKSVDVVRNSLVSKIIAAYDRADEER